MESVRCTRCDQKVGGLLGAFRARGLVCPNEDCGATLCVDCMPALAESSYHGFGPLRRGVLEIRCPECHAVLYEQNFPSELETSARALATEVRRRLERRVRESAMRRLGLGRRTDPPGDS